MITLYAVVYIVAGMLQGLDIVSSPEDADMLADSWWGGPGDHHEDDRDIWIEVLQWDHINDVTC